MPNAPIDSPPPELFFFALSPGDVLVEVPTSPADDSSRCSSLPPQADSQPSPASPVFVSLSGSGQGNSSMPTTPSFQHLTLNTPVKVSAVSVTPNFPEKDSTPRRRFMQVSNRARSRPRGQSQRDEVLKSAEKKMLTPGKRSAETGFAPKASHRRVLFQGSRQHDPPSSSQDKPSSSQRNVCEEDDEPKRKTPRKTI
ncbi:hypothetical protein GCK72_025907 [Caenorhabditis remanei]|uniref:Uncharacterized protein n=1 Tax=Caenorhabditis remanei TaxID=31234 RepID=A0A6A5G4M5_CAERE|nr:hypothetical protein GCK72_025907 [Caenorhabditis remanei]KAF1749439.1 hypothetical protein GCK72_025907 [Caenorhabditis remanei]